MRSIETGCPVPDLTEEVHDHVVRVDGPFISNSETNSVQNVITVCFEYHLDSTARYTSQKTTKPGLPGWV